MDTDRTYLVYGCSEGARCGGRIWHCTASSTLSLVYSAQVGSEFRYDSTRVPVCRKSEIWWTDVALYYL